VRLLEPQDGCRPVPPRWSTTAHLVVERHVLERLDQLTQLRVPGVTPAALDAALVAEGGLGVDQAGAVRSLCASGPTLRSLSAPAGYGKTTTVHAAAVAQLASG